jgi:hypothetical protein
MPFSYTADQADTLHTILKAKGLLEADWPRHLQAITQTIRLAIARETEKPVYAQPAATKLEELAEALYDPQRIYEALEQTVKSALDHHLAAAAMMHPLLMDSFTPPERLVVERMLSSSRFPLALQIIQAAAAAAAEKLRRGSKPIVISQAALRLLPEDVAKTVAARNGSRTKSILGCRVTGAPKDEAFRYAVHALMAVYQAATGKRPTMSETQHERKDNASCFEERGFNGRFYQFAAAALGPARLIPKGMSLGAKIYIA